MPAEAPAVDPLATMLPDRGVGTGAAGADGPLPPPGPAGGADADAPAAAGDAAQAPAAVSPAERAAGAAPGAVAVEAGGAPVGTGDVTVLDRPGGHRRGSRRPARAGIAPEGADAAVPPGGRAAESPEGQALPPSGAGREGAPSRLSQLAARLEAALFTSAESVALDRLVQICGTGSAQVRRALAELATHLDAHGHATALVELAGGYQLLTRAEFADVLAGGGASRVPPLSRAAMETLAIVAFWQPVTRAAVDELRGVHSEGAIATLLERGLIAEAGRAEAPGRPYLYVTTKRFLEHFGLGSLDELAAAEGVPPVPRPDGALPALPGPRPRRIERMDGAAAAPTTAEAEGVGAEGSSHCP